MTAIEDLPVEHYNGHSAKELATDMRSRNPPNLEPSVWPLFALTPRAPSPPVRSATKRIIVAIRHGANNYVIDLTGYSVGQAIRQCLLSKLQIPGDLHSTFSIYRTEFDGAAIGRALDDVQLLIDCQRFGDDKATLKFLAQRLDSPASFNPGLPVPAQTISMLPSPSSFPVGTTRAPSSRCLRAAREWDRDLAKDHGREEHIIVAVTYDGENYVVVDLTGYTEAQATRKCILSKLHIPSEIQPTFSIYRTELGGAEIGGTLSDTQLLLDCQRFGDSKATLKFIVQCPDVTLSESELVTARE